ncbi:AraC family transcriptional regulator [Clostridium sp. SL.3.18]|nr:AraC family transcriptional regulator [Clostridium sp. SL.3.18]
MSGHFYLSNLKKYWVFPLIAGIIFICCSLLAVNVKVINLIKTDKIRESENTIGTVSRSIDHYLLVLQQSASELMLNNQNMVLRSTDDKRDFTSSATYRYSEMIHNIKVANSLVDDIYLYYPKLDYVVGTEGSYRSKNYFLISNQLSQSGYEDWMQDVLDTEQSSFFLNNQDGEKKLYFRQHMPGSNDEEFSAVLIMCVDSTEFTRLLDMALLHDGSTSIAVVDENNELYQTGGKKLKAIPKDFSAKKIENADYIGWRMPSEYSSLSYVVVSNKEILFSPIIFIQRLLIIGVVLCTVAGLLVSLFLGYRQHASIQQTISSLNEKVLWSLKENTLSDILNQRLTDLEVIRNLFQTSGITLDYMYYCFVLADVSFEKDKKKIREWMKETGRILEAEEDSVDVMPVLSGNTAVFLLNYEPSETEITLRLAQIFESQSKRQEKIQASNVFMSPEQLVPTFEQTLSLLQSQSDPSEVRDLSTEKEGRLLLERWEKALLFQDYTNARTIVRELFHTYVLTPSDSYVRLSRQYVVVHQVLQCLETEDARYHTNFLPAYLEQFKRCTDTKKIPEILSDILNQLEQVNNQYSLNHKDKLSYRIKKIIEDNYNKNYLGLCYISEQVNVSTSYVSKVFKEEYGMGVVEYMNRLRIDEAKEIMKRDGLTVKEIAEKVGFTSDIHFIRIFKKYENTTPGVYQRQNK